MYSIVSLSSRRCMATSTKISGPLPCNYLNLKWPTYRESMQLMKINVRCFTSKSDVGKEVSGVAPSTSSVDNGLQRNVPKPKAMYKMQQFPLLPISFPHEIIMAKRFGVTRCLSGKSSRGNDKKKDDKTSSTKHSRSGEAMAGPTSTISSKPTKNKNEESSKQKQKTEQFQWQDQTYRTPSNYFRLNDDEINASISKKQEKAARKAREETSKNVRRALFGNVFICLSKFAAWMSCGSSAMLSEFVHSVVDCGNQALLLVGLRDSASVADRKHPYGYGKAIYFWALVSALGTFWLGAGVSMRHSIEELLDPSLQDITWQVWAVLGVSFTVDGWVLTKTIQGIREHQPKDMAFMKYVWSIRDPATIAVLLEDGAACLGIVIASTGIVLTHATGLSVFDGLAGVAISGLLASMGLILVRLNQRFLLGQAVDHDIIAGIEKILLNRRSIDLVHSVQSQWTGPYTFSYKAAVDFDGTYLAAKLMPRYQKEFIEIRDTLEDDLPVLLSWYAEDVVRTVEREVRHIEAEIRKVYPGATYIELEPDSKDFNRAAIDDGMEAQLKRIEMESLNRYLRSLYIETMKAKDKPLSSSTTATAPSKDDENVENESEKEPSFFDVEKSNVVRLQNKDDQNDKRK